MAGEGGGGGAATILGGAYNVIRALIRGDANRSAKAGRTVQDVRALQREGFGKIGERTPTYREAADFGLDAFRLVREGWIPGYLPTRLIPSVQIGGGKTSLKIPGYEPSQPRSIPPPSGPPVPQQPPDYPYARPYTPPRDVFYSQQPRQQPTQTGIDPRLQAAIDRLQQAFDLRDLLIMLRDLFRKPPAAPGAGGAPGGYYPQPYYPQPPTPITEIGRASWWVRV